MVITGKTATPEFGLPCYTETDDRPARPDPVGPEPVGRRVERRRRGRGGGRAGPGRAGQRRRRVDPDPVQRVRAVRDQADPRPGVAAAPLNPDLAGLSTNGPLARTVADAALLLDVMAGNFPGDMYTLPPLPAGETFLRPRRREPGRLRIGRSLQHAVEGAEVHPDCVAAYEDASALLASLGHEVEDVTMPFGPDVVPVLRDAVVRDGHAGPDRPGARGRAAAADPLPARARPGGARAQLLFAQAYLQAVVRGRRWRC